MLFPFYITSQYVRHRVKFYEALSAFDRVLRDKWSDNIELMNYAVSPTLSS
jgi:hypothetical protein